jgi:subtilisin family serine protease
MQLSLILALAAAAVALPAPLILPAPVALPTPAPLLPARQGSSVPGRFIVKMKNNSLASLINNALNLLDGEADHVYDFGDFSGFAAEMSDDVLDTICRLPGVEYVEQDAIFQASWVDKEVHHLEKKAFVTQNSASWGLGRISNVDRGDSSYTYDDSAGANTCSYVLDTGIYTAHPEFEGRAVFLANFAGDGSNDDGHGHGTHVAGTVGSKTYGVAKKTKLYAIKVLSNSGAGTTSGIIAGINFAANDAKSRDCANGAVANLSLGGPSSSALNTAVAKVVTAGLFVVAAAGNAAADARDTSPASEATAFTVGATDSSDRFASFSNFGASVDVLAPGVSILSTSNTGGTQSMSGTSMAAPHVAGLAAYILGFEGKMAPSALAARLQALSLKDKITGVPSDTRNYLAHSGALWEGRSCSMRERGLHE